MAEINATVGSAIANSYQALDGASEYFANRLGAERWEDYSEDARRRALLSAVRVLDSLPFIGARVTETQALKWPRVNGLDNEELTDLQGREYAADVIPQPVKDAQCEIALAMLLDPSLNDSALIQAKLKTNRLEIDHTKPAYARLRMAFESLHGLLVWGTHSVRA